MKINEFKLERYFDTHEFTAKYLLSSSDCDGFALSKILEVADTSELQLWENLTLGYTESQGHPLLRESILSFYQTNNINQVLVASPGELNFIAMNVLLTPKDHVICISPSYQSLYEIVRSIGCDLTYWKPNEENWQFDVSELEKLIQVNTKLIIINFPHNPTGSYLDIHELNTIVEFARKHGIYIFSDEMYHQLAMNAPVLPPISDIYEKGISLWGTSKSFGLAGLRIGWLVSQDTMLLKKILAFKDYLSICNSAPSEILSIIALRHSEHFILPNLAKIKSNIALFTSFIEQYPFITSFTTPRAGSTAFVKINSKNTALAFSNHMVEKAGIMTVPAEMFEYEGKYLRIGFGRENFPEVIERFADYLKQYDLNTL